MCIRDSFDERELIAPVAAEMNKDLASAPDTSPGEAQNQGCLLYTSDAADERSSVDLGGRRIIKKKKMRQPRRIARQ